MKLKRNVYEAELINGDISLQEKLFCCKLNDRINFRILNFYMHYR